jgi:hypothetical protein
VGRLRVKLILVCLIVLAVSHSAWAQLTGTAQVLRARVTNNVTLRMPVEVNDRLTTAAHSALTLTFVDNSTLSLSRSSTVIVAENAVTGGVRQSTLIRLLAGSVNAFVNTASTGLVRTSPISVASRGD